MHDINLLFLKKTSADTQLENIFSDNNWKKVFIFSQVFFFFLTAHWGIIVV